MIVTFKRRKPIAQKLNQFSKRAFTHKMGSKVIESIMVNQDGAIDVSTKIKTIKKMYTFNRIESNNDVLIKLKKSQTQETHLLRLCNGYNASDYHRLCQVYKKIGPYGVRTYSHRLSGNLYSHEVEYIEGLKSLKDVIDAELDADQKVLIFLDYLRKILTMLKYFETQDILWPDLKASNIFIKPNGALCAADTKNMYLTSNQSIPTTAFTKVFTAPEIRVEEVLGVGAHGMLRYRKQVPVAQYPEQLRFSLLMMIRTTLPEDYKQRPGGKQIKSYFDSVIDRGCIFSGDRHLHQPVGHSPTRQRSFSGSPGISPKSLKVKRTKSFSAVKMQLFPSDKPANSKSQPKSRWQWIAAAFACLFFWFGRSKKAPPEDLSMRQSKRYTSTPRLTKGSH